MKNERHVLGLSGGRDSAALAVFMRQTYPQLELEYYFTDTGKELPEVYEFLGKLEGFLGRQIVRLNPDRDFDFWLREYNHYLPSPQTRWCTKMLKIRPFEEWIRPSLRSGQDVYTYVAIRADESQRQGYSTSNEHLKVVYPFRNHNIDKKAVLEILEASGVGMPAYYRWRSRSGCTFCFFQQKIEWVRLKREHPDAFEEAKRYEKSALSHGSPFTWSHKESLEELERPERIERIERDFARRAERAKENVPRNPLHDHDSANLDVDDIYLEEEGGGACLVCHK